MLQIAITLFFSLLSSPAHVCIHIHALYIHTMHTHIHLLEYILWIRLCVDREVLPSECEFIAQSKVNEIHFG